jgi:hypothetical protein
MRLKKRVIARRYDEAICSITIDAILQINKRRDLMKRFL